MGAGSSRVGAGKARGVVAQPRHLSLPSREVVPVIEEPFDSALRPSTLERRRKWHR